MRVWIADSAGAPENVEALEARAALFHPSSSRYKLIQQELALFQPKATKYSRAEIADDAIVWFASIFGGLVGS
jgi:hypothetical protein